MAKSYEISTIRDVIDAVDNGNLDGFLEDLRLFLKWQIRLKRVPFIKMADKFLWNDDGVYGKVKEVRITVDNAKDS